MDAFSIASTSFRYNRLIPKTYSCEGKDISPQLSWKNVPDGTKSFAIIVNDPDAPSGNWIHWIIYNIPSSVRSVSQAADKHELLALGAINGVNDFGKIGYNGPCPPHGNPHRYFFTVYALDKMLKNQTGVTAEKLMKMMNGHILAKAALVGLFSR